MEDKAISGPAVGDDKGIMKDSSNDFIVRLRGLPYSAQVKDVMTLLSDCRIKNDDKGIHFSFSPDGRPSGEAFVELCSDDDVEKALGHNHEHMGWRYVEIFRALLSQMEWDLRGDDEQEESGDCAGVVRLRGLPYGCTQDNITTFFSGINLVPGGITFQVNEDGRETGGAFVKLCSEADVEKALARDRKEIQHRYIEVFRSSHSEVRPFSVSRPTPYSRPGGRGGGYMGYGTYGGGGDKYGSGYEKNYRGGRGRGNGRGRGFGYGGDGGGFYDAPGYYGSPPAQGLLPHGEDPNLIAYPAIRQAPPTRGGFAGGRGGGVSMGGAAPASRYSVRMRGLPYSTKEKDIVEFFLPLVVLKVNMSYDQSGRPAGESEVYFPSHEDATAAMQKNNQHIGHRYIELFLNSSGGGPATTTGPQYAAEAAPVPAQGSWGGSTRGQSNQSNAAGSAGGYASYASQQPQQQQQAAATYQPQPQQQHQYQQQPQPAQFQQETPGYAQSSVGYQPAASAGYQQGGINGAGYGQHQATTQQQWGTGY